MKEDAHTSVNRKLGESDEAPIDLSHAVSGKFVSETLAYDHGRQVTVYVPSKRPEAIVFAGDGQRISKWGRLLEKASIPSTMVVGVHGLTEEMPRLHRILAGL